ncbi:MAG TPA: hypothetical protein VG455_05010 [Acidimicrobiales bacterium]|nr:hypothetical protein [Acidimicrobiales bacterium]
MNSDSKRSVVVALMGLVAALVLFAAPAHAEKSGKANADNSSVASGEAHASDGSVASGDSVATDGSVSSGCSVADDDSTASGGVCDKAKKDKDKDKKVVPEAPTKAGERPAAQPAQARQVDSLAFTGPRVAPELAAAGVLLVAGGALMALGTPRRRPASST